MGYRLSCSRRALSAMLAQAHHVDWMVFYLEAVLLTGMNQLPSCRWRWWRLPRDGSQDMKEGGYLLFDERPHNR